MDKTKSATLLSVFCAASVWKFVKIFLFGAIYLLRNHFSGYFRPSPPSSRNRVIFLPPPPLHPDYVIYVQDLFEILTIKPKFTGGKMKKGKGDRLFLQTYYLQMNIFENSLVSVRILPFM